MALLEAMLAGKPIVASATAGIPEAIVDGRDGLLVEPGNAGQLSQALTRIMSDPRLRQTLAESAKKRGEREFTVQVMADRYEELYATPGEARLSIVDRCLQPVLHALVAQTTKAPGDFPVPLSNIGST